LAAALVAAAVVLATWLGVALGIAVYDDARASARGSRDERTRSVQPPSAVVQQWMESISLGSQTPQLTGDVLARAILSDGRSGERILDGRVVYFTVTTLDDFGSDRLQRTKSAAPSVLRDALDGEDDGWIELARPNARAPLVIASITQYAPRKSTATDLPLLRLQPLLAVKAEELAQLDDGTLLASAAKGRLEYAVAADPRTPQLNANFPGAAQHFDPRYLALPTGDPALERIVRVAEEWSDQAESDAECALAIVERFQNDFTYSLEGTGADGLEGLARCLERRAGSCTPIAATCVVMLRSQGIPSRAVAGLLGKEFDSETGAYILRQRHGHAWVEAHFEGLGWVRLEPTPSSDSRTSGAAGVDPLDDVGAELAQQVQSLAAGDVSVAKLRELGAQLARAPSALAQAVGEGRTAALAVVGLVGLIVLAWLLRPARRALESAREASTPLGRARAYEERLVDALVKLGAQAGRARTLREIATSPTLRIEEELQPALARAVDVLNAVRFGGATLEREEQHELDELLRELKAARSEPSEPEVAPAT
jgi:transglutaminase-like putative cysteine protease